MEQAQEARPRGEAADGDGPPRTEIPAGLRLTLPDTNDRIALEEWDLSALGGWALVFDLGYYAHFERLLGEGVSFVSRLHSQASYRTLSEEPSSPGHRTPEGDTVLSDETVDLGSPNNRTGAVLRGMRLITSRTGEGEAHRLITDRHDLAAHEVVSLCRKRWRIGLFFRWLKAQAAGGGATPLGSERGGGVAYGGCLRHSRGGGDAR